MQTYFHVDWLSKCNCDIFATVTLKQALRNEHDNWHRIQPESIKKTAWLLRDRVSKAVFGSSAFKKNKIAPFLVFTEGDSLKRHHLHIATQKPPNMETFEYETRFVKAARSLEWIYDQIDIRQIDYGSVEKVIAYSLKTGTEAFLPEASFVPQFD